MEGDDDKKKKIGFPSNSMNKNELLETYMKKFPKKNIELYLYV